MQQMEAHFYVNVFQILEWILSASSITLWYLQDPDNTNNQSGFTDLVSFYYQPTEGELE